MSDRTCSVPDCDRPLYGRGWCNAHYQRWRRGIDLTAKPLRGSVVSDICVVDDCGRPTRLRGWCYTHYERWRTTGNAGGAIADRHRNDGPCNAEGCERPGHSRGWCPTHYRRWYDGREVEGAINPFNYRLDDDITYSGMHMRLRRERGSAAEHNCTDCGGQAEHWSYSNADPEERLDAHYGYWYSVDPNHYAPRCISCHARFDRGLRTA